MDIYILVASGGECSDAWQTNVGVFVSEEDAELYKEKIIVANDKVVELWKNVPQFNWYGYHYRSNELNEEFKKHINSKEYIDTFALFEKEMKLFQDTYGISRFQDGIEVQFEIEKHTVKESSDIK